MNNNRCAVLWGEMTQDRRPAKQIICHKLPQQCDENKSLGGILRSKKHKQTENNSIKNLSKQDLYEKAGNKVSLLQ